MCFGSLMNIDKLIPVVIGHRRLAGFGSLMNIDKLIHDVVDKIYNNSFGSLMNIDKLIHDIVYLHHESSFGSLMNIKLKETACGILFCKLLFYIQRGDRGTAFFGII